MAAVAPRARAFHHAATFPSTFLSALATASLFAAPTSPFAFFCSALRSFLTASCVKRDKWRGVPHVPPWIEATHGLLSLVEVGARIARSHRSWN